MWAPRSLSALQWLLSLLTVLTLSSGETASGADQLYLLAQQMFGGNHSGSPALSTVHIIRVPKASSSSLSMVARRMVGCHPPGPCCRWPGDPPGSCPAKGLHACEAQRKVIGCTHHHPNYESLRNINTFTMTVLREPVSRAMSAYGYGGASSIHYNGHCNSTATPELCAEQFASSNIWTNIAVKLLSGKYAYEDMAACRRKADCEASLELAIENLRFVDFLGVTELWQVSLLTLHAKVRSFTPSLAEFLAAENGRSRGAEATSALGLRVSNRSQPSIFATSERLGALLSARNALDGELYAAAVARLCSDVRRLRLWQHPAVRSVWWASTAVNVTDCSDAI